MCWDLGKLQPLHSHSCLSSGKLCTGSSCLVWSEVWNEDRYSFSTAEWVDWVYWVFLSENHFVFGKTFSVRQVILLALFYRFFSFLFCAVSTMLVLYQSPVLVFSKCCVMIKIMINCGTNYSNNCRHSVYRLLWKKLVSVLQFEKKKKSHASVLCRSILIILWYRFIVRWKSHRVLCRKAFVMDGIVQINQVIMEII